MTAIDRRQLCLGRRAFLDPDVYAAERTRIFRKCWLFVGLESEIPTPGDYVTRQMAEDPVIVCRDEDPRIQVLLYTCRHRGAQLCSAASSVVASSRIVRLSAPLLRQPGS